MILQSDRGILRKLANKQLELANSAQNQEIIRQWKRHAALKPGRPMIHVEIDTFEQEVITPLLQCTDPIARRIEADLYRSFTNQELFGDDKPIPAYFPVSWQTYFHLFGHRITRTVATDTSGGSLGHQFNHVIGADLEADYEKLKASAYGVDAAATKEYRDIAQETFGDILPVKMVTNSLDAVPTQNLVHLMGMENMYVAMMDTPELFLQMMDRIADDYTAFFKYLQDGDYLLPTTSFEMLTQGTFCFTDELPQQGKPAVKDVWGFMDSQETVSISPAMFGEFIFPCYKKIGQQFGLLSYGCCEPVDPVWPFIKTLENLRRISISPWCDEQKMSEQLKGSRVIYHRKPSPNYLGVGTVLDEDAVRRHITKTLRTAAGCQLEITQRDVYTVHGDADKVRRYVSIIRQCAEKEWNP